MTATASLPVTPMAPMTPMTPIAPLTPLAPHGVAGPALAVQLRRVERRKRLRAIALTLPLLLFLAVTFLVPLGALWCGLSKTRKSQARWAEPAKR